MGDRDLKLHGALGVWRKAQNSKRPCPSALVPDLEESRTLWAENGSEPLQVPVMSVTCQPQVRPSRAGLILLAALGEHKDEVDSEYAKTLGNCCLAQRLVGNPVPLHVAKYLEAGCCSPSPSLSTGTKLGPLWVTLSIN